MWARRRSRPGTAGHLGDGSPHPLLGLRHHLPRPQHRSPMAPRRRQHRLPVRPHRGPAPPRPRVRGPAQRPHRPGLPARRRHRPAPRPARCWSSSTKPATPRCGPCPSTPPPSPASASCSSPSGSPSPRSKPPTAAHADTILTNHLTKVFYAGLSDPASLRYVAQVLGDAEVETRSQLARRQHSAEASTSSPPPPRRARPRPHAAPDAPRRRACSSTAPCRPRTSAPAPTTATAASPTRRPLATRHRFRRRDTHTR